MGGSVSIEAERAIHLASSELEAKLRMMVQVASGELDAKLQQARVMVGDSTDALDYLRGKTLSTSIALVYFTSLVSYALYKTPVSGTTESSLFMLQFMILSVWIGQLVEWRDAIMILLLALSFLTFIYQRGRSEEGVQPGYVKAK